MATLNELACPKCGGVDIEVGNPGGEFDLQAELANTDGSEVNPSYSCYHCKACNTAYHYDNGALHMGHMQPSCG